MEKWVRYGKGDLKGCTHTLMSGGGLKVPNVEYMDFLQVYAEEIVAGRAWSVVEFRPDPFRFFVDLDIVIEVGDFCLAA